MDIDVWPGSVDGAIPQYRERGVLCECSLYTDVLQQ
jgi:hypothetical protein